MSRPAASECAGSTLTAGVALSAAGAVLTGFAPVIGLVAPEMPTGFTSWPCLLALGLIPAALSGYFLRSRPSVAAAVLLGPAVLVPGRFALDAQLAVDAGLAARPELLRPTTLDPLAPAAGTWVLLAGHALTAAAGVLAVVAGRKLFDRAVGSVFSAPGSEATGARRQGLLALVLCASVLAGVGVLMAPFLSDDPYVLAKSAVDGPPAVLAGSLLLALAIPSTAGFVAGSTDPDLVRGGLLGLAAAVGAVVVPPLLAVALLGPLRLGWGPVLGLAAAIALVALALVGGRSAERGAADVRLPALSRLLTAAGALALASGVLAILGAVTPHLEMPSYLDDPSPYPARLLWPGGIAQVLIGAGLLVPRAAPVLRPALTVTWAMLPLAGAAALDTVLTATQVAGAHAGPGSWISGAAMALAGLAAVVAALAGGVERDDVDLTEREWRLPVAVPGGLAALLVLGAVFLPVLSAPGYTPPGVFTEFGTASWGLIATGAAALIATALAPRSRPWRAVALLGGAVLVMVVRVLEFPVTSGRTEGATPAMGLWCAVAAVLALAVTAAFAARPDSASRAGSADGHDG